MECGNVFLRVYLGFLLQSFYTFGTWANAKSMAPQIMQYHTALYAVSCKIVCKIGAGLRMI
jgi:hypothetical protein